MNYGDELTVKWGASDCNATEYTGSVTYTKTDPNDSFTVYITGPSAPYFYAWYTDDDGNTVRPNGSWPGKQLTNTTTINGREFYCFTFHNVKSVNFILNSCTGAQTADITGITGDSYFEWDGAGSCTRLNDGKPDGNEVNIYFDNSQSGWANVYMFVFGSSSSDQIMGSWPGKAMTFDSTTGYYKHSFTTTLLPTCSPASAFPRKPCSGENMVVTFSPDSSIMSSVCFSPTIPVWFDSNAIRLPFSLGTYSSVHAAPTITSWALTPIRDRINNNTAVNRFMVLYFFCY